MNREEGMHEIIFQMTMSYARKLFQKGLLSEQDYEAFDIKMQQKWQPKIGGLFSNLELI